METGKKEEAQAVADYGSLKDTKSAELKAAEDKIFTKTEELAKAKETAANSKESLEDTTTTVEADTTFLSNLKVQCANIDNDWEIRSKVRSEEIAAVGETIGILTDDDARDTMSAAGTFMQLRAQSKREVLQRERAADFLAKRGKELHSPRISYLSTRLRNDVFSKVKESIDGMVVQHGHEEDVEVEIEELLTEIKALDDEEAKLKAAIAD